MVPQPGAGLGAVPGFASPMPYPGDASGGFPSQPAIPAMPPISAQPVGTCPPVAQAASPSASPVTPARHPVAPAPIVYESGNELQNQLPMSGKISFVHEDIIKRGTCGNIPENAYKVKISGAHFANACGKCVNLDVGGGVMVKAHIVDQCQDCRGDDIQCGSKLESHFFSDHSGSLDKINWNLCDCS